MFVLMVKRTLLIFAAITFLGIHARGQSEDLFNDDLEAIRKELDPERFNLVLTDTSQLNQLLTERERSMMGLSPGMSPVMPLPNDEDRKHPLYVPSIVYGLVLGPVGYLIVVIGTDDRLERRKALLGCGIATVVYTTLIVVAVAQQANAASESCGQAFGDACSAPFDAMGDAMSNCSNSCGN